MPIEWVGESLSPSFNPQDAQQVTPSEKGDANRDPNQGMSGQGRGSNPYSKAFQRRSQRLERAVYAREVMQNRFIVLKPESPLSEAAKLFVNHAFEQIPVRGDDGKLVGMVSYRAVLRVLMSDLASEPHYVQDVMDRRVLTATGNTLLREIARVMVNEEVHCIPILDNNQKIVGVLTANDMLKSMVNHSKLNVWI